MKNRKRAEIESYIMVDTENNVIRMDANFIVDYLGALEEDVLSDISDKLSNIDLLDSECVIEKDGTFWISGGLATFIMSGFIYNKKCFAYFLLIVSSMHELESMYKGIKVEFNGLEQVSKWGGLHYAYLLFGMNNPFAALGKKRGDENMACGVKLGEEMFNKIKSPLDTLRFLIMGLENDEHLECVLTAFVFSREVLFNVANLAEAFNYDSSDELLAVIKKRGFAEFLAELSENELDGLGIADKIDNPVFIKSGGVLGLIKSYESSYLNELHDWLLKEINDLID